MDGRLFNLLKRIYGSDKEYIGIIDDELRKYEKQNIYRGLSTLSSREEFILRAHFGIGLDKPKTLAEIGYDLVISGARVSQIEQKAVRRLRHPAKHQVVKGTPEDFEKCVLEIWDVTTLISDLKLSTRCEGALKHSEIFCMGQLIIQTRNDLLRNKNLGRKGVKEIEKKLFDLHIRLKPVFGN